MADRLPPNPHRDVDRHLLALRHSKRSHTLVARYHVKAGVLVEVEVDPPPDRQKILDVQDDDAHTLTSGTGAAPVASR